MAFSRWEDLWIEKHIRLDRLFHWGITQPKNCFLKRPNKELCILALPL